MLLLPLLQGAATLLGVLVVADGPAGVQAGVRTWTATQTAEPRHGDPHHASPLHLLAAPPPGAAPAAPPQAHVPRAFPPPADTPPPATPEPPSFDYRASGNVTALLGETAVLRCRVRDIANKTVSWIRHRDVHLLSVGRFTYTSDERFVARHVPAAQDWLLHIHHLQERDAGLYECQISTTPPRSHLIHLAVVVPETVIAGGPDVYINTGSQLALTCTVKFSPEPPAFILWYHEDKVTSQQPSSTTTEE